MSLLSRQNSVSYLGSPGYNSWLDDNRPQGLFVGFWIYVGKTDHQHLFAYHRYNFRLHTAYEKPTVS